MGRIIAFPDMKSRLHQHSGQSDPVRSDSQDNVILFDGVFVEYHDKSLKAERSDAPQADFAHPIIAKQGDKRWPDRKTVRSSKIHGPDYPSRQKHR